MIRSLLWWRKATGVCVCVCPERKTYTGKSIHMVALTHAMLNSYSCPSCSSAVAQHRPKTKWCCSHHGGSSPAPIHYHLQTVLIHIAHKTQNVRSLLKSSSKSLKSVSVAISRAVNASDGDLKEAQSCIKRINKNCHNLLTLVLLQTSMLTCFVLFWSVQCKSMESKKKQQQKTLDPTFI